MPARYQIDKQRRFVFTRASGILTDEHMLEHQRALTAEPDFEPSFHQLTDLRDVTEMQVTSGGVWDLAQGNPYGRGSRRAIVAPRDVAFGMARMFEMSRGEAGDEVQVFRDMKEALEWLGLDEEPEWETEPTD